MSDFERTKQEIWALEQAIYTARSNGDMSLYIDNTSPNYIAPSQEKGWSSVSQETMRAVAEKFKGLGKEQLDMNFKGFTLHGDTAVIYYINHRTMMPDGESVDQWYEVMHIWVREEGAWKLLGSMPRQLIDYKQPELQESPNLGLSEINAKC